MKQFFKKIINPWTILGVIIVLALVLRIFEIDRTSFWYDEAFTGDTIKLSWNEMFRVIAEDKVHPPLFYILIRLWADVFGFTQDSLRGFSTFFGVSTIVVAFAGIKNIFEKNRYPIIAISTAFVLAIAPFFVAYSCEARAYSFLAFLAVCLAFSVVKWLDTKKWVFLILSLITGSLMCATHYLQVVFIIALLCSVFIYKFVFTEKGINRKWLYITLSLVLSVILALIFLPIKAFVNGHGITGMWWVPDVKISDLLRIFYSYFLGVVRYVDGVPIMRDMIINIPKLLIAGIFGIAYFISYGYIVFSKKFELSQKRQITLLFWLSVLSFAGFYILSVIGFNAYVERYMIAGGIILFLTFWIMLLMILKRFWKLIPIVLYIGMTFLLTSQPSSLDYRKVASALDSINASRYVFLSPTDYIDTEFYMSNTNTYYFYDYKGQYPGWALLDDEVNGIEVGNTQKGDVLIASEQDLSRAKAQGFTILIGESESLYFLSK